MSANYHFLPWVRQGLATAISEEDTLDANTAATVSMQAYAKINEQVQTRQVDLRLHHPGDVAGVNRLAIIRKEPAPWTRDFEPNFFPAIEFDLPYFPWLFTPAAANQQDQLRPWLVLVCVRQQEGVSIIPSSAGALPVLQIAAPAAPDQELPDLADSWAWAHSQVVAAEGDPAPLEDQLLAASEKNLSRLICPRKLEPNETYFACLVPAFESGRKTGLGIPLDAADEQNLQAAWTVGGPPVLPLELPIYYHWEFSTAAAGDFESLVRKLQARPLPPEVGQRRISVTDQPFNLPDLGDLTLEGALRPVGSAHTPPDLSAAFTDRLEEIVNQQAADPGEDPVVTPPLYGGIQTDIKEVPGTGEQPLWLRELNMHPIHRIAAGFGTMVIQDQQDELMAAAWESSGEKEAQELISRAQLAREVSKRVFRKNFIPLAASDTLLQVTAPVQSYLRLSEENVDKIFVGGQSGSTGSKTFQYHLEQTVLPKAVFSQSFRRIARMTAQLAAPFIEENSVQPKQLILHFTETPMYLRLPADGMIGMEALQDHLNGIPGSPSTSTVIGRLQMALPEFENYLTQVAGQLESPPAAGAQKSFAPSGVETLQDGLLAAINPENTMKALIDSSLAKVSPGENPGPENGPDPLSSSLLAPSFEEPMYKPLQEIDQNLLLPGIEHIPDNTVTLLETNPAFVAAYMVGLNQEMSREFLWREYPAILKGTFFQRFWEGASGDSSIVDCPPIHTWDPAQPLGHHCSVGSSEGQLVFLIRGELLRRFPNSILYAVPAASGTELGQDERYPLFQGYLEPDIRFFGFDLTLEDTIADPGWFFVIQQQPTEARFGFDLSRPAGNLSNWNNLTWNDITTDPTVTHVPLSGALSGTQLQGVDWGYNAAHMAMIMMKKPLRLAIPAGAILPHTV